MKPVSTAISALILSRTNAHGINCKGSYPQATLPSVTSFSDPGPPDGGRDVYDYITTISDDVYISPGQPIACKLDLCAFMVTPLSLPKSGCSSNGRWEGDEGGDGGMYASEVKDLAAKLILKHGCDNCGTIARGWPEGKENKNIWCGGGLRFSWAPKVRGQDCPEEGGVCGRWLSGEERQERAETEEREEGKEGMEWEDWKEKEAEWVDDYLENGYIDNDERER